MYALHQNRNAFLHASHACLTQCLSEWKLFQTKVVDWNETSILCQVYFSCESSDFRDNETKWILCYIQAVVEWTCHDYYAVHICFKWLSREHESNRII
jgi:hypothetical protein